MNKRFFILGSLISLFTILFFSILVKLQIIEQSFYRKKVDALVTQDNTFLSLRGRIFDTYTDKALVYNISRYSIYVNPDEFPRKNRETHINEIATMFSISEERVRNALGKNKQEHIRTLVQGLTYEELTQYLELLRQFRGISWRRDLHRYYELNESMSHVIGHIGDISASELRELQYKNYQISESIGKTGVEKQYENELRGKKGKVRERVNVFGQRVLESHQLLQASTPGYDIVLTLDRHIQELVEKALGERIGAAVVMKSTGEILAMASYPRFNPNLLVSSADTKNLQSIQNSVHSPFINRAMQALTPPASSFKVLMSSAFLHEFPNQWNFTVRCIGYIAIGNRRFYCWVRSGHGLLDIEGALAHSCNVFFYALGLKLGASTIAKYAQLFGLGAHTGVDLPFEVTGTVPSPLWKQERFHEIWQNGDTANMSIGQGFLEATPLQLAQMVTIIINNGVAYKPHVLKELRDQVTEHVVYSAKPEVMRSVNMDKDVYRKVRNNMRSVVTRGTARVVITTKQVKIAAKTGTGQITGLDHKQWHSLFLSYAPFDAKPEEQIVVVFWVDAVNEWEWWAPKAANIVYEGIFSNLSYEEALKKLKKQGAWYL